MNNVHNNNDQVPKPFKEDLSNKEIHYRRLFETAPDGILVVDAETGMVIDVNPFLTETLGYPSLDIINKPVWELGFLKKVFSDKNKLEELKQNNYVFRMGLPLETSKGARFDVDLTGNSYEIEHQKLIQLHFQFIRERKEAESKLDQSERRFHQLIEQAPIGIALSQQGKTIYVNSRYLEMFGFEKPEEILGTSFLDQVAPQSRVEVIERAMQQEQGLVADPDYDIQGLRKNGSQFPFQAFIARVELENGSALIGYFTDVTERKKIEEQLNTVLIHQKTILSAVPDIIMEVDTNKTYTWANQAGLDFFGDDVIGKPASYYFVGDQDTYKTVQPIFDGTEDSIYVESWQRRKDGQQRLLAWWGRSLKDTHGHVIGGLSAANDITERDRSERENQILRDKSEMSSRLAAVGEMAAGIAHEINNPLTGIIGFSELLLERPGLPEDVMEELKIINDGSTRVKEIVSRMLTFARQTKPHKSSVSISELLDNTLELRSYVLKTSNIVVVRDYDHELPWVIVDAGQLQQVFLNIIVNAEYAMKKANGKGILTIKTESVGDNIRVSIRDNGPGMSDEIKAKLFQPFFTTKDPGEGTGLGLSLSHGIVQDHGGTIRAESVEGQGTTFIIELPVTSVETKPISEPPVAPIIEPVKRARVLVVDDEPAVRALITKILTQDGHIVEECVNASQVLEKLAGVPFDILLVDLRMPGMDGMELYREISSGWPKLAHKVIFITGDTSDLNTRQYLAARQLPFISKPFDRKTLESTVNRVLLEN